MPVKTPKTSVSAKLLEPVIQLARHYPQKDQTDYVHAILAQAQLTADEFNNPGVRFPAEQFPAVLKLLTEFSANPLISLSLGEATQPQTLGSVGFMMSTATTLGMAYQVLIDYLALLHEGIIIDLEKDDNTTTLTFELNQPAAKVIEFFTACLMNWPRHLTGHQIPAKIIRLTLPQPENDRPYQQHLAAEIEFSASQNQIIFDSAYFNLPCIDANPEIHQLHRDFADTLMSRIGVENALTARTRSMIRQQLLKHQGLVRREEVAATFGMSLRSFQRKLGEQGASFQEIYDQTRKDLCLQLIQQGQHSFGEISYQLGFSNQSAFQKAFKRWTQTTPSHYRAQLQPELLNIAETNGSDIRPNSADTPQSQQAIKQATDYLTQFCRELLEIAAIGGQTFNLQQLSELTAEPIARLAIHLWPPEQSRLITGLSEQGEKIYYQFNNAEIQQFCYQTQPLSVRQSRHAKYAHLLLQTLPIRPDEAEYAALFQHIKYAGETLDKADINPALNAIKQAKTSALQAKNYNRACDYQAQILRLSNSAEDEYPLRYQYAELLLLANRAEAAQAQMLQLKQQSTVPDTQSVVLQSRIYQHLGHDDKALSLLLQCLQTLKQPLPSEPKNQLDLLVSDLQDIQPYLQQVPHTAPKIQARASSDRLMLIYEQICLLSRKLEQPLLSACAITGMIKHTFEVGPNRYSAFAFASFAWVASWFCADITSARRAMQLSRLYMQSAPITSAEQYSTTQTLDPAFILSAQVEHWITPVEQVKQHLHDIAASCAERHLLVEQNESMQLRQQLSLFRSSDIGLSTIANAIQTQQNATPPTAIEQSTLYMIAKLTGDETLSRQAESHPTAEFNAAYIFCSFLLQNEEQWPQALSLEAQLENQLPGYFCLGEALFAAAMIKVQQAQQRGHFTRKREYELRQSCSRFELWAESCAANFSIQSQLLYAEYQRFKGEAAGPTFDRIISQLLKQPFSYLLPLAFQRYGAYLGPQQPQLASLCLQRAKQHYLDWGANIVAERVDQELDLLAQ